ncbi:diguanylate cyclase [Actinoplanes sp. SE50]|uniref:tetratricopeptide repeat-containing diguanylate cyclase n=1 Tax=unclassified Actinoplanes TaxID=2626549 RepID=UPI00023EE0D1|nr:MULTISPECIES: GGDEF domain-containing protein [unclassified Actinoplanes]AEV89041.1 diguanylate cyclase [Actinoplanes sp. SE50/110]ATO87447.1 diguanylate cyclase [Actinoplanes sp. SE50]SLM04865.1 diguanylate cyclase [Actinoplanes sp. SE50/110]
MDAETLSAVLLTIEDRRSWDATAELARTIDLERIAVGLGDELLAARARLCQINMRMRCGDVARAAEEIWHVHQWAVDHDARRLLARTHLVWVTIHLHLGDAEQGLEHAVLAVELLDDSATEHMQVWHRTKLADALYFAGDLDAARERYTQAEQMAQHLQSPALTSVLNNFAYVEASTGNRERAEALADRLQQLSAESGIPLEPAFLDTIGSIQVSNGNYAAAAETMRICIARHAEGKWDDANDMAQYLVTLAQAQRGLEELAPAQASLDEARRLCIERDLGESLVRVLQEQAELFAAAGDFAAAFHAHKNFFEMHHQQQSLQKEARARTRQAMFETTEARQEAERFREQARRDPLTGLHNRRYVDERLPGLIETDRSLAVALVDLDHFKQINDLLSHDVGDRVLVQVAQVLAGEVAAACPDGFVARMGGEEFLVVLPDTPVRRAATVLDAIRRAVRGQHWAPITSHLPVTVSIGIAGVGEPATPGQAPLLSIADGRLYAAKRGGRDRVVSGAGLLGCVDHFSAA